MEYIERFLNIIILPFKALLKILAIIGFFLLIIIHCLFAVVTFIPILSIQLIEYITIWPLYYIATGKKYGDKYCTFMEMALDLIFLERPFHNKEKQSAEKTFYFYRYDKELEQYVDPYSILWRKIKNINLKLNYKH